MAAKIVNSGPTDFSESPLSLALQQPLLLGVFLNLQDIHFSSLPSTSSWTFDYNAEVVKTAEALGFDFAFSRQQWLPKGIGYDGEASLDAFLTMAAFAPLTQRMLLISTLHVLYGPWHPLHLAKFGATLDHITKGRWGLNIVTGHRATEHEMFGWSRIEHDRRYELAAELLDVVQTLWRSDENFSFEGRSGWKLKDAYITPKPLYGRPLLVNATGSDAGIDFAARYSDLVFVTSPGGKDIEQAFESLPAHTARIKQAAADHGRAVRIIINPIIVSRDTEREAFAYADAITDNVQTDVMRSAAQIDSDAHAWRRQKAKDRVDRRPPLGANVEIIGSPEQVVEQLAGLKAAGIDGVQLSFYDFIPDLEHFGARILPLLEQAGLRNPIKHETPHWASGVHVRGRA